MPLTEDLVSVLIRLIRHFHVFANFLHSTQSTELAYLRRFVNPNRFQYKTNLDREISPSIFSDRMYLCISHLMRTSIQEMDMRFV